MPDENEIGESQKELRRCSPAFAGEDAHETHSFPDVRFLGELKLEGIGRGVRRPAAVDSEYAVAERELKFLA